jgi:hypothetical protein
MALFQQADAGPGDHIQTGNTTITPGLDLGMEFRSNVLQSPTDPSGGPNMLVQPGLGILTDSPDTRFDFNGVYTLRKYFSRNLSQRADRFSDFDVGTRLELLRKSVIGFHIQDRAAIRNDNTLRALQTRIHNGFDAQLAIRPGAVLQFSLGGRWNYDQFIVPSSEDIDGSSTLGRRNAFGPTLDGEWRFFPRTAVILQTSYLMHNWSDSWVSAQDSSGQIGQFLALPNSQHFKAVAGLRGRLTSRFVLSATIGYGFAKYDPASVTKDASGREPADATELDAVSSGFDANAKNLDGLLGEVQLKYELADENFVTLGYQKDFEDVFFSNFVALNRVYLRYQGRYGKTFGLDGYATVSFDEYKGETTRSDIYSQAQLDFLINATDWMSFSIGTWWHHRSSSERLVEYDDFNGHIFASFEY